MNKPKPPIPKLDDVASRAGVSTATVSRFYNNPAIVAPATAERIRAAIEATGYVPNLLAGGLASNRSRLVAVLVPEIAQSIFNDTIEAMSTELSLDGNVVMLGLTGADNCRMPQLIDAALARRADAIILTGIVTDAATRERLRQRDVTVIETWGIPEEPIDIAVGFSHHGRGPRHRAFPARARLYAAAAGGGRMACARGSGAMAFIEEWTQRRPQAAGGGRRAAAHALRAFAAGVAAGGAAASRCRT